MMPSQRIPALEKPLMGQPCNGCGYCCLSEVCPLGVRVGVSPQAPCSALVAMDGQYLCGLLVDTAKYLNGDEKVLVDKMTTKIGYEPALNIMRNLWAYSLGAGLGCDSDD